MKEFDLEKAKAGEPVITREGKPARILCFDLKSGTYNILYAVDDGGVEFISSCDNFGRSFLGKETPTDLFMAANKKKGWINIYRCNTSVDGHGEIYHTKEDAVSSKGALIPGYITTIEIEWEE